MTDRRSAIADLHDAARASVTVTPLPTRRRWSAWTIALVLTIAAVFAGAGYWHIVRPIHRELQLRTSLLSLGILYEAFRDDHRRTPASLDEFQAFVATEASGRRKIECRRVQPALDMARDGSLIIVWSLDERVSTNWNFYLACEARVGVQGGFVLRRLGTAEWMSASDFTARMVPYPSLKAAASE